MLFGKNGLEPIDSYALVAYLPDPLGVYLDRVRLDLVPSCVPHSHVTVLPPRPLRGSPEEAIEVLREGIRDLPRFEVAPAEVEIFGMTSVIYVALSEGEAEFREMHDRLNTGPLRYAEPYPYHPHITLAQQLACEQVMGVYEVARMKWAAFPYKRRFVVDTITFVQNTRQNKWLDLAYYRLQPAASLAVR
jgi:2'-5' RNA ligase